MTNVIEQVKEDIRKYEGIKKWITSCESILPYLKNVERTQESVNVSCHSFGVTLPNEITKLLIEELGYYVKSQNEKLLKLETKLGGTQDADYLL